MAVTCSSGHQMPFASMRAYVSTRDDTDEVTRDKLIFCKNHGKDFLSRVSAVCEYNGTETRGPFHDNTVCHWGQHELEDYSAGAVFVTVYVRGAERVCYRSLLCDNHLGKVRSDLNLNGLTRDREALGPV